MTHDPLAALMADVRLSADARVLGFHIARCAPDAEIERDDFRRLLGGAGKERVYTALGELELWKYIERKRGGRGHADRFRFTGGESPPLSDSGRESPPVNGFSGRESPPLKAAPSTTTDPSPPPPPTARVNARPSDVEVARLRDHLGEHAAAVDMMLDSADHPTNWIAAVLGKYGPTGTQQRAFTGIPPDRWTAVLATALMEFATAAKPYGNQHFDGFIRKAVENERRPPAERRGTGTDGGRAARPDAAPVGGAAGQPARNSRFQFRYE